MIKKIKSTLNKEIASLQEAKLALSEALNSNERTIFHFFPNVLIESIIRVTESFDFVLGSDF